MKFEGVSYGSTPPFWGMSNIFFEKAATEKFEISEAWGDPEYANLVTDEHLPSVYVIRYKLGDTIEYRVDTDGDLDFLDENLISFKEKFKTAYLADFELELKKDKDRTIRPSMELIVDGKWAYGRVRDYHRGWFKIKKKNYLIELHLPNKNQPYYDLETFEVLLDFNRDDSLMRQSSLLGKSVFLAEKIYPGQPFLLEGKKFVITDVKNDGGEIVIEKTRERKAASVGFSSPSFKASDLQLEKQHVFPKDQGLLLLEFWSEKCPNSPIAHKLMKEYLRKYSDRLDYVVISREYEIENMDSILNDFPMEPTIVYSEAAWKLLNDIIATPRYYLIKNGEILYQDVGSNSAKVLERILNALDE